ncbi:MAG: YciI family protein [Planctomycetota bacterium]|nr:YciI family protein [Planctomycetota bacterium]
MGLTLGLGALALATVSACSSSPPTAELGFTFLVSGERGSEYDAEELAEIGAGHFANMDRLKEQGKLLLAGPFYDPLPDLGDLPAWRGIYLFATDQLTDVQAWTATDPGMVAGVFAADTYLFDGTEALVDLPAREAAARVARLAADPETPFDGFVGRSYTIVLYPGAEAFLETFAPLPEVPFAGRLTGPGPYDGHALVCLTAETPDAARTYLETHWGDDNGLILSPWYASDQVATLTP